MGEYAACIILYLLVVACVVVTIMITAQALKTRESLEKDIELSHHYINALTDKIETMPVETAIEILQVIDARAKDICFDTPEEQDAEYTKIYNALQDLDILKPIHRAVQSKLEAIGRYNNRIEGAIGYGERDT